MSSLRKQLQRRVAKFRTERTKIFPPLRTRQVRFFAGSNSHSVRMSRFEVLGKIIHQLADKKDSQRVTALLPSKAPLVLTGINSLGLNSELGKSPARCYSPLCIVGHHSMCL